MQKRLLALVMSIGLLFGAGARLALAESQERPSNPYHVECDDQLDNDGDGLVDYPEDPGCESATDENEDDPIPTPQCSDGIDNDGDGLVDFGGDHPDPGCESADDDDETDGAARPQCSDGIDNDGDGLIDFEGDHPDPGCENAHDDDETDAPPAPQCSDGIDNDTDGLIDFGADPGCDSPDDDDETNAPTPAGHRCEDPDGLAGAGGGGAIAEQLYHGGFAGTPLDGTLVNEPKAGGAVSGPIYDGGKGTPLEDLLEDAGCLVSFLDSGSL